ncbi:Hsp70 family protein [Lachnospiraceae bacterium 47-T17]
MSIEVMKSFGGISAVTEAETVDNKPVFGIDLGTTNSAISVIQEGTVPVSILLKGKKLTMPSCVMWHHGKFIVGREAYEHREQENVIYSVKRHMQSATAKVKFIDGNDKLELTPAEVSAEILKGLVAETGGFYGEIKDVVVTVPAYFNQIGRDNTRKACQLAGLNPISIINEPTAASLCYDLDTEGGSTEVVVYDLGGGTFDITIAKITSTEGSANIDDIYGLSGDSSTEDGKSVNVIATAGDSKLGGDDLDLALYVTVCNKLRDQGINPGLFSQSYREGLILRLEHLKKTDIYGMYDMNINTIGVDGREITACVRLIPDDFQKATEVIYKRTKRLLTKVLKENNTTAKDLVLVGGSTKNPLLQELLNRDFPQFAISNALNPDLSVSDGAAIHGKSVKFGDANVTVFDILPITIGILDNGRISPIIKYGSCLPVAESKMFTTTRDDQKNLTVRIFQGNSTYPEECIELGELTITDINPQPAGKPNLIITVSISADSMMICEASIDGKRQTLTLNLAGETTSQVSELTRAEKSVIKWRRLAQKCMDENQREKLLVAIDDYAVNSDASNKAKVLALVKEISSEG